MGQPSIQKHHFDGPVLLCTALALGPHLGGALRSVVREKSAGSSRSSRRDLRPDFRRVAPRRAATPLAPNCPKMRAIDRSRPRHFFETKRSPTFFFSAPTFFGKNLPRQHFFLKICFCATAAAVRSELEKHYRFRVKIEKFSRRLRRRESYMYSRRVEAKKRSPGKKTARYRRRDASNADSNDSNAHCATDCGSDRRVPPTAS